MSTSDHPPGPRLWCPDCGGERTGEVEAWRTLAGTVAHGHQRWCDWCASTTPPVTSPPGEREPVAYLVRAAEDRARRDRELGDR